ncbi:MAG TPA: hypothetical protein P5230_01725 [Candidatus Magasanikbacteria bacterium]|nr:hypothetical protein [Candidatus Magasanikbacteria bacterium]
MGEKGHNPELQNQVEEKVTKELLKQFTKEMQNLFEKDEPLEDEFYKGKDNFVKNSGELDKNTKDKLIKIAKLAEKLELPCFRTGIRDVQDEDLSKKSIEIISNIIKFKDEFTSRQDLNTGLPLLAEEQKVITKEEEKTFTPFIEWHEEKKDIFDGMENSGSLKVYLSPKEFVQVGNYYTAESERNIINIAEAFDKGVEFSKFINNLRENKVNYLGRILTEKEFKEQEENVEN